MYDNNKQEQLKLDVLNKIFLWVDDEETKAVLVNKYSNNEEHRMVLKAFLDDVVRALDESTIEEDSRKETKRQLSYIT